MFFLWVWFSIDFSALLRSYFLSALNLTHAVFCEVSFDPTARTVYALMDAGNEPERTQTPFRSEGDKCYFKGNGQRHCRRNCEIGVLEGGEGERYCCLVCKPFLI